MKIGIIANTGLVEGGCRGYTVAVKRTKLLHILLAVLLAYGQLAASYHVVGHFYPASTANAQSSDSATDADDHHAHSHGFANSRLTAHRHSTAEFTAEFTVKVADLAGEAHANEDDHVEADCELYHALSSLSVVFPQDQYKPLNSSGPAADVSYTHTHISNLVLQTNRIRGPPVLS